MGSRGLRLLLAGLALAGAIALISPFASARPDGLERVAEDQGFLDRAKDAPYEVLPDYTVPGIASERVSTILSGLIGIILVTGITLLVARLLARRRGASPSGAPGADLSRSD